MQKFTFNGIFNSLPIWTPDSSRIIFDSRRDELREGIYSKAADGSGKVEQILKMPDADMWPASILKDGNILFFVQNVDLQDSTYDIGMLSIDGDRTSKLLLKETYDERWPQISPEGRWLAYMSNENGRYEIFVRPFPDVESGSKYQVSTDGGEFPLWSPDGTELFYRGPDAIMGVKVEPATSFKHSAPRNFFPDQYIGQFDIHPDSEKFLMLKEPVSEATTEETPRKINIVLNWFEELKERVPVD